MSLRTLNNIGVSVYLTGREFCQIGVEYHDGTRLLDRASRSINEIFLTDMHNKRRPKDINTHPDCFL